MKTDEALWRRMLDVNLGGAYHCIQAALPGMLDACLKRADIAHARILDIDVSKALALPGVSKAVSLFWDPDGNPGNGFGGAGLWDTSSVFWADDLSAPDLVWTNSTPTGNDAIFQGTPGTVTLGQPIVARLLDFNVAGYSLSNGGNAANTLTLAGSSARLPGSTM